MSKFFKLLITGVTLTAILVIVYMNDYYASGMLAISILLFIKMLTPFLLLLWLFESLTHIKDLFVLKYRITKSYNKYSVECLKISLAIVPHWGYIKTSTHSFDWLVWGTDTTSYYYMEIKFKSREDALSAIEKHKEDIRKNRRDFFRKPNNSKENIEYIN
jgi:hypothetical protein